ncbi:MAG: peroxiredoxin [Gammaproteobacteria bacterium]|nr:peroxiredoxin [Gammaproteobacteria bacterium]
MPAKIGRVVRDFKLPATGEQDIRLKDLRGQNVVLYFYPRDNTPGCTTEGENFRDAYRKFRRQKTEILGVSRDSVKSHEKFRSKFDFPFQLLADEDEDLCEYFEVMKDKNMYGKKVRGIERSTFLIDADGKLRQEWRKVKVPGHVDDVLDAVKNLNK